MPEAPAMNQYAVMAQRHWQQHLPQRTASLQDPTRFFAELGAEVEQEIQELAEALAGDDPPGETYLEKLGRLNMARLNAEGQVLRERVLLPAEAGTPDFEDQDEPPPAEQEWIPLVEDPSHPYWQQARQEHEDLTAEAAEEPTPNSEPSPPSRP